MEMRVFMPCGNTAGTLTQSMDATGGRGSASIKTHTGLLSGLGP